MKHQEMDVDEFRRAQGIAVPHKAQRSHGGRGSDGRGMNWTPREDAKPGPVVIELPMPPQALRPNARCSWRVKLRAKSKAREESGLMATMNRPRLPFQAATLHSTWFIRNRADQDNLIGWLKAYIDGLQDGGVIVSDRELTILAPAQVIDRKNPRVVLTIEERK